MKTYAWWMLLGIAFGLIGAPSLLAAEQTAAAKPSPELVEQGKALYNQFCKTCHGVDMVNPGTSSFDLRTFPHDDRARFVSSVMNGKNTMPPWGDLLTPEEIDAIWAYVRTGGAAK